MRLLSKRSGVILSAVTAAFTAFLTCLPVLSQNATPLVGGVSTFEPHSLLGKWNGHIKKFGRHPKLYIDTCADGQISGTYKGIFGQFPVSGQYNDETGAITMYVDFSKSKLARFKRFRSGRGIIEAKVSGTSLIGYATVQDLAAHQVKWEATKEPNVE
ncbi:MAG: hypothetical protein IAF58_21605 [Leptolyngbya sp.]|nr:hypothetical protein [Candidatus Melainabacteria bacterium]